jgi:biotin--protein ligase
MNIRIYNGTGTSSVVSLMLLLQHILYPFSISTIDFQELSTNDWKNNTSLLIIPGGVESFYERDLLPIHIAEWVSLGNSYFGICAGSYFASDSIEFELNRPDYAYQSNDTLHLAKFRAVGSISRNYAYNSLTGVEAISINYQDQVFPVFVNGGPAFISNDKSSDSTRIIATYSMSNEPAIIQTKYGKGTVILSGPHIEISIEELTQMLKVLKNTTDNWKILNQASQRLQASENFRQQLFLDILSRFGLL